VTTMEGTVGSKGTQPTTGPILWPAPARSVFKTSLCVCFLKHTLDFRPMSHIYFCLTQDPAASGSSLTGT
jgi:hypothetical protein